jgi:NAD-dependent SIR2 family protein deacetylase
VWRRCDLRCESCQGAIVPSITLFGGGVAPATADRLHELQGRCAVVLVLGQEANEPATREFLDHAREAGATVAFVSDRAPAYPRQTSDVSVHDRPERFLAHLQPSLDACHALWRLHARGAKRPATILAARRQDRKATG